MLSRGPRADVEIPVDVDYTRPFGRCEHDAWKQEYLENIQPQQSLRAMSPVPQPAIASALDEEPTDDWYKNWFDYAEDEHNVRGGIA